MTDVEIQQLVNSASRSDAAGLECLLEHYQTVLLNYARKHIPQSLRCVLAPEDVLQDTFFEAFRRLREFNARDPESACHWLTTILRNRIINVVNAQGAQKRASNRVGQVEQLAGDDPSLVSMLAEMVVYERTPSKSAIAHELAAALEQSISRLPADYQRAVRLRYIEQQDVETIAIALGRTSRAVHMVCNRALKALREEMRSKSRFA